MTTRAALLAAERKQVLVLSFSVTLANRLRALVTDRCQEIGANPTLVTCANFHSFCERVVQDAEQLGIETTAPRGERWPHAMFARARQARAAGFECRFDAVLIDERQDFTLAWWDLLRIGGGCDGETSIWTPTRFTDGSLDVEVTPNGGCAPDSGWNWVRVSPVSSAGRRLAPGHSGATPRVTETLAGLYGIWLRLDTGDTLSIGVNGQYLLSTQGDTLAPDDTGQIEVVSPGVIRFTSGGSGGCAAGDTWTWTDVTTAPDLVRDGNPRGTTMRTETSELCGSVGSPPVWHLLSPDLVAGG